MVACTSSQSVLDIPFLEGSLFMALAHPDASARRHAMALLATLRLLASALEEAGEGVWRLLLVPFTDVRAKCAGSSQPG